MKGAGKQMHEGGGDHRGGRSGQSRVSEGQRGWGCGLRGQWGSMGQATGGAIAGKRQHPLTSHGEGTRRKQKAPLGGSDEGSLEQPHGRPEKERASETGERK